MPFDTKTVCKGQRLAHILMYLYRYMYIVYCLVFTYIYNIHGGPTGMVVANMAVDGPFFQPANVEGTGSHHSWL